MCKGGKRSAVPVSLYTDLNALFISVRDEAPNDLNLADGEIESNWDTVTDNFDNMELKPELLRGIYAYG